MTGRSVEFLLPRTKTGENQTRSSHATQRGSAVQMAAMQLPLAVGCLSSPQAKCHSHVCSRVIAEGPRRW